MKYLIVNADDFGASRGINRGIIEAHQNGILTSTSLLVGTVWSEDAVSLAGKCPDLSLGLHVDLSRSPGGETHVSPAELRAELQLQLHTFREMTGYMPSHLDSHHNIHRNPQYLPEFRQVAAHYGLPLRENCKIRHIAEFYGRWSGQSHPEQISREGLVAILQENVGEGFAELACHPGYMDADFPSGYFVERPLELRTLCDPRVRAALKEMSIELTNFRSIAERRLEFSI